MICIFGRVRRFLLGEAHIVAILQVVGISIQVLHLKLLVGLPWMGVLVCFEGITTLSNLFYLLVYLII